MVNELQRLRAVIERFGKIPDNEWELLEPHIKKRDLSRYQLFSEAGKRSFEVGFVLTGTFRQLYLKDGEERTTYFYFPDDLICSYLSCITGKASLITMEALTDASLLTFPYPILLDLYKQSHAWQSFGRMVAEYIAMGLEERMVSLLLQSPEERYRDLLSGSKIKIIEQIPQQYIANYLGITPVSMSRIRKRVANEGRS